MPHDRMMDEFDRWIRPFIRILLILLAGIVLGYAWRYYHEPLPEIQDRLAFRTVAEEQEHRRLLRKHGLENTIAVVYSDALGEYYIREGRRCAFQ